MGLADAAAKRATCDRGRAGCVIVRDRQVLVTGYVGSPQGLPHCDDVGHLFKKLLMKMVVKVLIVLELFMPNKTQFVRLPDVELHLIEEQFMFAWPHAELVQC